MFRILCSGLKEKRYCMVSHVLAFPANFLVNVMLFIFHFGSRVAQAGDGDIQLT